MIEKNAVLYVEKWFIVKWCWIEMIRWKLILYLKKIKNNKRNRNEEMKCNVIYKYIFYSIGSLGI